MSPADERIVVHVDEDLHDLIPEYLARRREEVTAMEKALARGDHDAIRVIGHKLKGSGAGYGFAPITTLGGELEVAAKAGDAGAIARSLAALADYLARVDVA